MRSQMASARIGSASLSRQPGMSNWEQRIVDARLYRDSMISSRSRHSLSFSGYSSHSSIMSSEYFLYGYLNQNGDGEEMEFLMVREDGSFLHRTVIDHASKVIKRELRHQQFDFHSLRHTHATELSEYGVNLKEIQRRLGHKTLEVTVRTYLHATDVMEAESMQIMKQMYGTT